MKIATTVFALIAFMSSKCQVNSNDSLISTKMYKAQQYLTGASQQKDEAIAFQLYLQCAELGKPQAMNMAGVMFKNGIGTKANKEKAIEWFTKAGKAGYANGWYLLGSMYKNVSQDKQDYNKAFIYFSNGAALNDELCEYAKAYMLYKGFGCTQDYQQAAILFSKGAEKGKAHSMYFYGLCLRNGYGVLANIDSAKYWLTEAAKKGYIVANKELATIYPENDNKIVEVNKNIVNNPVSDKINLNTFQKINQSVSAQIIDGNYIGYLITYDWSGQFPVSTTKLQFKHISYRENSIG